MRLIVAETGNYLIQIQALEVLPALIEIVVLSPAVLRELQSQSAPPVVRVWAVNLPSWIEILVPTMWVAAQAEISHADREAISLAHELKAVLLMDGLRAGMASSPLAPWKRLPQRSSSHCRQSLSDYAPRRCFSPRS